jgi:uncharacterized protein
VITPAIHKWLKYHQKQVNSFFWRTTQQQKIDYIEESNGQFAVYEFKFSPDKKVKFSQTFLNNYPISVVETIHTDNYLEFVTT